MAKIGTLNRIAPATLTGPNVLTIKEARAARRQREIQINKVEVINASTIVKKTLGEPLNANNPKHVAEVRRWANASNTPIIEHRIPAIAKRAAFQSGLRRVVIWN